MSKKKVFSSLSAVVLGAVIGAGVAAAPIYAHAEHDKAATEGEGKCGGDKTKCGGEKKKHEGEGKCGSEAEKKKHEEHAAH